MVIHKAFGEGLVSRIENGSAGGALVYVRFGKTERTFGFPGAFYDGFLRLR